MTTPSRSLQVLVADDAPANQRLLGFLLKKLGYTAEVAADGHAAVALCQQRRFDAILMDIEMPGCDGYAATRRIRAESDDWLRRVAIIGCSAHDDAAAREAGIAAGMTDWLTKPIDLTKLGNVLEQAAATQRPPESGTDVSQVVEDVAAARRQTDAVVFCSESALRRIGNDTEFLLEMIEMFGATVDELLEAVRQAVSSGDAAEVRETAHAIKGVISSLTAGRAFQAAQALEYSGRDQQVDLWSQQLTELSESIPQLIRACAAWQASLSAGDQAALISC